MNIDCETKDKCRLRETSIGSTTCLYYPPVYDGNGINTNPDMNVTSSRIKCDTCGKEFIKAVQGGETTYEELK